MLQYASNRYSLSLSTQTLVHKVLHQLAAVGRELNVYGCDSGSSHLLALLFVRGHSAAQFIGKHSDRPDVYRVIVWLHAL